MSTKPRRRKRPSMYKSVAEIRRQIKREHDAQIHPETGLPWGTVENLLKADIRYCIFRTSGKGKAQKKAILHVFSSDDTSSLNRAHLQKKSLQQNPDLQSHFPDYEYHIGMCEVKLITSTRIRANEKVRQWIMCYAPTPPAES